ncbi:Putative NADPH-quinone reductase (modulator of drug activity B) [Gracilibacillus orientalis]|uniref:Putative NADPH-quinone reductase (Modulator of drug activity B) n=1 Tax=Gracilibacillus orientalis TaxID=334253 RepID=A0A1I4L6C6_9BACI|nr:NAD(P)H-dependent oxidoreductase [Gracilibacillus orientalis]SFL86363.1 Putative NADPH-quinone reductase (modulator of drug activity B) [Gracilibacillus orientalis]
MKTIVYNHPWNGSYNHAILTKVVETFKERNQKYQIIDLYQDEFDPTYHASELKLYSRGKYENKLVGKYQSMLNSSNELIFIFPVWWYNVPAILKGFLDKVLLKDFAYIENKNGTMKGLLTNIQSVKVITTGQAPKWYIQFLAGNGIKKTFIKSTLKAVGMKNIQWIHCGYVSLAKNENRVKFLYSLPSKL